MKNMKKVLAGALMVAMLATSAGVSNCFAAKNEKIDIYNESIIDDRDDDRDLDDERVTNDQAINNPYNIYTDDQAANNPYNIYTDDQAANNPYNIYTDDQAANNPYNIYTDNQAANNPYNIYTDNQATNNPNVYATASYAPYSPYNPYDQYGSIYFDNRDLGDKTVEKKFEAKYANSVAKEDIKTVVKLNNINDFVKQDNENKLEFKKVAKLNNINDFNSNEATENQTITVNTESDTKRPSKLKRNLIIAGVATGAVVAGVLAYKYLGETSTMENVAKATGQGVATVGKAIASAAKATGQGVATVGKAVVATARFGAEVTKFTWKHKKPIAITTATVAVGKEVLNISKKVYNTGKNVINKTKKIINTVRHPLEALKSYFKGPKSPKKVSNTENKEVKQEVNVINNMVVNK